MIEPQPGDLFLIRSWWQNHVAIYLAGRVYEAWPPVVRRIEWWEFIRREPLNTHGTVLRAEWLTTYQLGRMAAEAERLIGEPYSWWRSYWLGRYGWHCWSYVASIQSAGLGWIYGERRLSSVSPRIGRRVSLANGWREVRRPIGPPPPPLPPRPPNWQS